MLVEETLRSLTDELYLYCLAFLHELSNGNLNIIEV